MSNVLTRGMLILASLIGLAACGRQDANESKPQVEVPDIVAYQVPPERAEELSWALNALLSSLGDAGGNVQKLGPGTLLVLAPSDLQPSIKQAIDEVLAKQSESVERASQFMMRLWIIEEAAADATGLPAIPELDPVLEAIRQQFPLQQVRLVDAASLQLWGERRSTIRTGRGATVQAELRQHAGQTGVELALQNGVLQVKSQVPLALNKYLVLAEVGAEGEPLRRRFVVMHASEAATN